MKVKVRKHEKAPSLLLSERALLKTLASNSPNLYSAVQKAIRDISSEKMCLIRQNRNRHKGDTYEKTI